jgi:hypothetical protein
LESILELLESSKIPAQVSNSALGTIFKVMGGYLKPGTSFLKRAQKQFSELLNVFIEASRIFLFNFLHKRQPEILFPRPSTNIHLVTQSLQASNIELREYMQP